MHLLSRFIPLPSPQASHCCLASPATVAGTDTVSTAAPSHPPSYRRTSFCNHRSHTAHLLKTSQRLLPLHRSEMCFVTKPQPGTLASWAPFHTMVLGALLCFSSSALIRLSGPSPLCRGCSLPDVCSAGCPWSLRSQGDFPYPETPSQTTTQLKEPQSTLHLNSLLSFCDTEQF